MQRLLNFLYKYRVFNLFIGLEIVALWLVVNQNIYHNLVFFSSANSAVGAIYETRDFINYHVNLPQASKELADENARLRKLLSSLYIQSKVNDIEDLNTTFTYMPARVVNNSILYANNYLTIDKGSKDGIKPGMGVISTNGIVGQVKSCSENYATVYSLLHANVSVSSQLKKNRVLCTTRWKVGAISTAQLLHIPLHEQVLEGDTVVTSGYSSVFPPDILIGTVSEVSQAPGESFQQVETELATDFTKVTYVYVVQNINHSEIDSLETKSGYNQVLP